jgi:hypothetical protein
VVTLSSLVVVTACQSTDRASDDDGSRSSHGANSGSGASDSAATGDPTPGWNDREACQEYLECLAVVAPAIVGDVLPLYGDNGSCWTSAVDSAVCGAACREDLARYHAEHPDEPACPECRGASDCAEGQHCRGGRCGGDSCATDWSKCCEAMCQAEGPGCTPGSYWLWCTSCPSPSSHDDCETALRTLYACVTSSLPDSVGCISDTVVMPFCGSCEPQRAAAVAVCDPTVITDCIEE